MAGDLPEPDVTLARRVFAEVEFERRLVLIHQGRRGPVTITVYTMWEILGLLELPRPEIDLARIAGWIEETVGDAALAEAIRGLDRQTGEREKILDRVKYLIAERLRQCRERLG